MLRDRFPDARHLELAPNRGYSGGVNAGLELAFAESPWALLLTNDSSLVNLPEVPRDPAIVAPKILRRNTDQIDSAGGLFFPAEARLRHCRVASEFFAAGDGALRYIPGTCFLVHRDVFERAGPLREELCIYWDDVEWSRRIAAAGFPLRVDDNWVVRHGMGKTGKSNPLYSLYYFQRNRKWISWEFAPPRARPLLLFRLSFDWTRLFMKNAWNRRWHALPHLLRAAYAPLPSSLRSKP